MTVRLALILAATALAPAGALAQAQDAAPTDEGADASLTADKQQFLEACDARKFETAVEVEVDGKMRGRKVTLCGKVGQTDADWVKTLKDAAEKFETNQTMRPAVRDQIVAALNAEIAKVEAAMAIVLPPAGPAHPPLRDLRSDYSVVPPMPEPLKPAARTSLASSAPVPAAKKPRLTIKCLSPGESGGGSSCDYFERGTRLAIRADEEIPAGATLRFLRKGDARGEIALAHMRQGQTIRAKLPSQLCTGVATSKVEIQIVGKGSGQVLDTRGPFGLRC